VFLPSYLKSHVLSRFNLCCCRGTTTGRHQPDTKHLLHCVNSKFWMGSVQSSYEQYCQLLVTHRCWVTCKPTDVLPSGRWSSCVLIFLFNISRQKCTTHTICVVVLCVFTVFCFHLNKQNVFFGKKYTVIDCLKNGFLISCLFFFVALLSFLL